MSDLNVEYVESIVKLGLIERRKAILLSIGAAATVSSTSGVEDLYYWLQMHEQIDALIRDSKKLRQIAEQIVKASRE